MLLTFLAIVAIAVAWLPNLFAAVMLLGMFSLLSAGLFVVLDAVDVAFTEAAVGAGVSTILMLATLARTNARQRRRQGSRLIALAASVLTGGALIYGTLDRPLFGDPGAPIHQHVAPRYLERSGVEIGVPNVVTSVLASYRGYDTLGEVTVVFTAGIGVFALLGFGTNRRRDDARGDG